MDGWAINKAIFINIISLESGTTKDCGLLVLDKVATAVNSRNSDNILPR